MPPRPASRVEEGPHEEEHQTEPTESLALAPGPADRQPHRLLARSGPRLHDADGGADRELHGPELACAASGHDGDGLGGRDLVPDAQIADGRAEVEKCALNCDWFADHAHEYLADQPTDIGGPEAFVTFNPLGVVLAVMP